MYWLTSEVSAAVLVGWPTAASSAPAATGVCSRPRSEKLVEDT